jgi:hypothetical protein
MTTELIERLPDYFHPDQGKDIPRTLLGARILRIGTLAERNNVAGGGLVIDFQQAGDRSVRRIIFGFSELGMWVDSEQVISS